MCNTTYDVYAEDARGWLIDDRRGLPDMDCVKAYAEKFKKEYDPYKIIVTKHETYYYFNSEEEDDYECIH